MGAQITVNGNLAIIEGVNGLGAAVRATDLRAGAAMVIAGLMATRNYLCGGCKVHSRGYEDMSIKHGLGADILPKKPDLEDANIG